MEGRVGDLEIEHDSEWQRREWLGHRIGWGLLALFLVAAALGALGGDGPLREAEAGAGDGGSIHYDRFTRFGSPTELNITPSPDAIEQGMVKIGIASDYWGDFEVEAVTPQPDSVSAGAGEFVYTFLAQQPPDQISFSLQPREAGVQSAEIRVADEETVEFTQIVYP